MARPNVLLRGFPRFPRQFVIVFRGWMLSRPAYINIMKDMIGHFPSALGGVRTPKSRFMRPDIPEQY